MADKREIEKALRELSASQGGSLVKEVVKAKMKPEPVIFIGLGGLGGKTLEKLKTIIVNEYEPNPHFKFLAIDTAQNDLSERANLELTEKFEIYDPTCIGLPAHPPAIVKKWLNPAFPMNNLKSTGAEGTRQVARLMLCGTNKYWELRARIDNIIDSVMEGLPAGRDWVRINLIAGISGGTGSGTVIDVAYMIHDIMEQKGLSSYDLRGFFFTPDAQKNVPEIKNNTATWENLKRNAYAALKEIDYFMTNGKDGGGEPVYKLVIENRTVSSTKKIFQVGDCVLVSSTTLNGTITNVDDIVNRLSCFIAYIFTDMNAVITSDEDNKKLNGIANTATQDILSTLCNLGRATLPAWKGMQIKNEETDNPNWAGYHYSAIGYNSMYIPRDEIFAYCANSVFVKMYEEWQNIEVLNQKSIDEQLKDKHLDSLEGVFSFIKKQVNAQVNTQFRIKKDHEAYPEVSKILHFGKTKNTDATMEEASSRAKAYNRSINTPATKDKIVKSIVDEILEIVNQYFKARGPFYAIAMLSGLEQNNIRGFLQRIDDIKNNVDEKTKTYITRMDAAKETMEAEETERRKDITPTEDEVEGFVTACENYTKACADLFLFKKMKDILDDVKKELNKKNNETYKVYTTTIEVLSEMLHNDSVFATDSERRINGKGETFYFDAIGFNRSQDMRDKFLKLFADVIDDDHAQKLAEEFKNNMFGEKTINIWKSAGEDSKKFAQNIRNIFKEFFKEYTMDTLEKFLVLKYNDVPNLTPQRLTEIWDATEMENPEDYNLRCTFINNAANEIHGEIIGNGDVMIRSIINETHINSFPSYSTICLINTMPKINSAMQKLFPNDTYAVIDRDFKSSITLFKMTSGIPIATVYGMRDNAISYYSSERTPATKIGRHMDEGDQQWDYYLPEIYGLDADTFYRAKGAVERLGYEENKFSDLDIMLRIKNCVWTGLNQGWICVDNPNNPKNYNIFKVKRVNDEYVSFKRILRSKLLDGSFKNIWEIATDKDSGLEVDIIKVEPVDSSDNDLDILQVPTNDYQITDIHRVIRKNMNLMKKLFEAYDDYKKLNSIISIYSRIEREVSISKMEKARMESFRMDVNAFVKMFCGNLIEFDSVSNVWKYRTRVNGEFRPLLALNKGMMNLDKGAIHYLAFANGFIEKKDELAAVIETLTNPVAPRKVLEEAKKFLNSDMMTNLVELEKLKDLEEAVRMTPYKDYYNYPYVANGKDSTYRNLYEFYKLFVEYLKNYSE